MADDVLVQDAWRSGCPVIRLDTTPDRPVGEWTHDLNRLREGAPIYWNEHNQCWVLTRAKHVREVFQDPAVFTNDSISPGDPDPAYRWIPSNVNPPQHVQYRQILNTAFGPAPVGRAEDKARRYCAMAVDEVYSRGSCDYVAEIGGVYATRVFLELIDLPHEDAPLLCGWAERIFDGFFHTPDAMVAFDESKQYFVDLVADRRAHPRDPDHDFTSHLLRSSVDGELLTDDAVLNIFNQLMLAGLDTVKSTMSYAHLHLATHPDDRRRIVEDEAVIPYAVEEVLRAFPLVMEGRKLSQDVDFHGAQMKAGEMVMLLLPAVMYDPEHFDRPDEIIIDRVKNNHLSFGGGPHRCLGSHLARMEMRVGLEEWHRRIPDYELGCDVADVIERGGQLSLRGATAAVDPVTVDVEQLARRVARLEAIEIAKVTAARYGRACDAKDVGALRKEVFTPDAVLRLPKHEEHGIDAIVHSYATAFVSEPGVRRHFVINHVADVDDDGVVHMDSYFFFVSQDRQSVIGWGGYRDVVVIDDGVGRIRDKTILLDVYTTLDAGWALGDRAGSV